MIENKLQYYQTYEGYKTQKDSHNIPNDSLVFIEDTQQIVTHGEEGFGGPIRTEDYSSAESVDVNLNDAVLTVEQGLSETQKSTARANILDKETDQYAYSKLGRVILPKHVVNGHNTLTQDMFYKDSTATTSYDITIDSSNAVVIDGTTYYYEEVSLTAGQKITLIDTTHCVLLNSNHSSILDITTITADSALTVCVASTATGTYSTAYVISVTTRVPRTDTIYVIEYDYELAEDIPIPANCMMEFDGGSISGAHTLTGNNTGIQAGLVKIFSTDILFGGSWNISNAYPKWFGSSNDGTNDDTDAVESAINLLKYAGGGKLCLGGLQYNLTHRLTIDFSNLEIDGEGATIVWAGTGLDSLYTGVFQFVGSLSSTSTTVYVDEPAYTETLTVVNASVFSVGDLIFIESSDNTNNPGKFTKIISKIVNINGNTITIDMTKRLPLIASETVNVTKVNVVKNSGIRNCKFIATGQTSRSNGMGGVYYAYSSNVFAKNCSFSGFWFKGVKTTLCTHVITDNVSIDKAPAFSGGEGYGVQYEYTYNSTINNCHGDTLRHLIDLTCAWHIIVKNCFDANTQQASYSLHSAYEYDVAFINCITQGGDGNYAFALGSVNTVNFSDYTDKITLTGCRVFDFAGSAGVKFTSKGKGLYINNCIFEMRAGVAAYAITTSENDTYVSNSELIGGVIIAPKGGTYANDGAVNISNCKIVSLVSQRCLNLGSGTSVSIDHCNVEGASTISSNTTIHANGCKFLSVNSSWEFFQNSPSGIDGQKLYFENSVFDTSIITNSSYSIIAETLSFVGCKFVLNTTTNAPWNLYGAKTRMVSCEGMVRSVFSGAYNNDIEIVDCEATGVKNNKVIQVVGFKGRINISNCRFNATARDKNCIDLSDSGNEIAALVFTNNILSGIQTLTDERIIRCVVTGNLIDATQSVLPTAGANKFVENNLTY